MGRNSCESWNRENLERREGEREEEKEGWREKLVGSGMLGARAKAVKYY